ncbi:hypothetical protein PROVRETT_09661 [Providencia rettgeri DSM 1131]|nr:hypothetical protein PROVRETT_09661 [Providencia rettgeri DSM 1131]
MLRHCQSPVIKKNRLLYSQIRQGKKIGTKSHLPVPVINQTFATLIY